MRTLRTLVLVLSALLLAGTLPILAQPKWDVTKTVHIGGEGGWDYVTIDRETHRVFVTRSTHTMVIDERNGQSARRHRRARSVRTARHSSRH